MKQRTPRQNSLYRAGSRLAATALLVILTGAGLAQDEPLMYESVSAGRFVIPPVETGGTAPVIAVDIDDNTHVVWREGTQIYYSKASKDGEMLTVDESAQIVPSVPIYTAESKTIRYDIATDYRGRAHIALCESRGLIYIRIGSDGFREISQPVILENSTGITYTFDFEGADICIDPSRNLPVIGTLVIRHRPFGITPADAFVMGLSPITSEIVSKESTEVFQERVVGIRLENTGFILQDQKDNDGIVTAQGVECYAFSGESISGRPCVFYPPAIACDAAGNVHAVFKTQEVNNVTYSAENAETTDPGADVNQNRAYRYFEMGVQGISWQAGDLTLSYSNSRKAASWSNMGASMSGAAGSIFDLVGIVQRFGEAMTTMVPLRINYPNDAISGSLRSVPRVLTTTTDGGETRVHVLWVGKDTSKSGTPPPRILYSRIDPDGYGSGGGATNRPQIGTVEKRSRSVSSTAAPPDTRHNVDAALGDGYIHAVWVVSTQPDETEPGVYEHDIFHGAVSLAQGEGVLVEEYAIAELGEDYAAWPAIAIRPDKRFREWICDSDTCPTNPEFDYFSPITTVEVLLETYSLRATYFDWPGGIACADGDPIVLPQQGELEVDPEGDLLPRKDTITADHGFGPFVAAWQGMHTTDEGDPASAVFVSRAEIKVGIYGLKPSRFDEPCGAWDETDREEAMSQVNNTSVFNDIFDASIGVVSDYDELVNDDNFHRAVGVVADGVTPLLIRMALPAGEYYLKLTTEDAVSEDLISMLNAGKLQVYDDDLEMFVNWNVEGPQLSVPETISTMSSHQSIVLLEGFDCTDPTWLWPATRARIPVVLKVWPAPVNEAAGDPTESLPPSVEARFTIARPPVFLVHGFIGGAEKWAKEFEEILGSSQSGVGSSFVRQILYGQTTIPGGIAAELKARYPKEAATLQLVQSFMNANSGTLDPLTSKLKDGMKEQLPVDTKVLDGTVTELGKALDLIQKYGNWEDKGSTVLSLKALESILAMDLMMREYVLRYEEGWAFTRYDVVGHCQGGVLLRMLASNETMNTSTSFIQQKNFGRGRFRRIITIGAPHNGIKLVQYFQKYMEYIRNELVSKDLLELSATDCLKGLALYYYTSRYGFLAKKFDPAEGEIHAVNLNQPTHPNAKFHLISTLIDHYHYVPHTLFTLAGLPRGGNLDVGLFNMVFPPDDSNPHRVSDGIVEWRSHFGGVDYHDPQNQGMLTHLDEYVTAQSNLDESFKWASHIPPIPVTSITGPAEPITADDLKNALSAATGNAMDAVEFVAGMALKWLADYCDRNGVDFSLFGTHNTQTGSTELARCVRDLLKAPMTTTGAERPFGRFYNYTPENSSEGPGNPDGDGDLDFASLALTEAINSHLRYLSEVEEAIRQWPLVQSRGGTATTDLFTSQWHLDPPDDLPVDGEPIWSATVTNGMVSTTTGVTVTADAGDPFTVTVEVDPDLRGQVLLTCWYRSAGDILVQIEPVRIGEFGLGAMTGLSFATTIPALNKGESASLVLTAEYETGMDCPLVTEDGQAVLWSSSDPDIVAVSDAGLAVAGTEIGEAAITAEYQGFTATCTIPVSGTAPSVVLTAPEPDTALTGGDDLLLSAEVSDDGTVGHVFFAANGEILGESQDTASPYTLTWENIPPGTFELNAVALDDDGITSLSATVAVTVANRPPVVEAWSAPTPDQWYTGDVYCAVTANDPDGDAVTVQFEYSLDSTDGEDGFWAQCYYPIDEPPYDCRWSSLPLQDMDDQVWLRATATDARGDSSDPLTCVIKIDNTGGGILFSPHSGETDIPLNVQPTLTFEHPVTCGDGSELTDANAASIVQLSDGTQPVSFTTTVNPEKTVITIIPDAVLKGVTPYTVALQGELLDTDNGEPFPRSTATFVTTYGLPAGLAFGRTPTGGEAGMTFDAPVRVHVVDAQANTVLDSMAAITLALVDADGVSLTGALTRHASNGVAEFADLGMTRTGQYRLEASCTGLPAVVSEPFSIRPGGLASLEVVPGSTEVRAGVACDVTVTAYDAFGNLKTDYVGTPSFTSDDTLAVLPRPYTFYVTDAGTFTYTGQVRFGTLGERWLRVQDHTVASASATVTVVNAAPVAPELLSPADGGFCGLCPELRIAEFEDADNAGHAATRWQVALDAEFASVIWDEQTGPSLTVCVPEGILDENADYVWRARVKDASGDADSEWSEWSAATGFHTAFAFPFSDDFSVDRGWNGLTDTGWRIGAATVAGGENGGPDPGEDTTSGDDNGVLAYAIGDYDPWTDAVVYSPPIDCSEANVVELRFQRHLGVEGCEWANASIEVSADGSLWQTVWSNPATDLDDPAWTPIVYDITPFAAGEPTVFVRFSMGPMVAALPFRGWNIDDFAIAAGTEYLAELRVECPEQNIEVGDLFHLNIYVRELSAEASGVMGGAVTIDMPTAVAAYQGSTTWSDCVQAPFTQFRQAGGSTSRFEAMGGVTTELGHGDGTDVLFISLPLVAQRAGTAVCTVEPSADTDFSLVTPVGRIGAWRVAGAELPVTIAPDALEPLVCLTLEGPSAPVALGNTFTVRVYVRETVASSYGVLGGPLDLYFPQGQVSVPEFDPDDIIQSPYTDLGVANGTLLTGRIDELGGATMQSGHGNGTNTLYAVVTFQADAVGMAQIAAGHGQCGFALPTPVGEVAIDRTDYGAPILVDIRPNFHVNVTSAHFEDGNGNFVEGQQVYLLAEEPATGMVFDHWEGDVECLADANSSSTTVNVPGRDIVLTAHYRNVLYPITVTGGTASVSEAVYGQEIQIAADPEPTGQQFQCWTGDVTGLDSDTASETTLTMPASAVALTASYEYIPYSLTVNNGSGDTTPATYGQRLPVQAEAAPVGYSFHRWDGDSEYLDNPNVPSTTFTMPAADATITAVYTTNAYVLTVNAGQGTTQATYGEQLTVVADQIPTGWEFDCWTGATQYLDDALSSSAIVTMPAESIAVTATYKPSLFALTVGNGTGDTDVALYQEQIVVTADNPPVGQRFKWWTGDWQILADRTASVTAAVMPARDAAISAEYHSVFRLTVVGGEGSGDYPAGTLVTIEATAGATGTFAGWGGMTESVADPDEPLTSLTMPASDVTILARVDEPLVIDLLPGWNLVSPTRTTISPADVSEYVNAVVPPIWGWDGKHYFDVAGEHPEAVDTEGLPWHTSGKLIEGHGYWIYAPQATEIVLP